MSRRLLVFFHARNFDRLFETALRTLLAGGDRVHVAFDTDGAKPRPSLFDSLEQEFPGFSCGPAPERARRRWSRAARELRLAIDWLRYLEPDYADAPALRDRARRRAPRAVVALVSRGPFRTARGRGLVRALLLALERTLPADPEVARFVATFAPDVVVVSPLVSLGSMQGDYVRAARRLGIRSALLVASWDNLTNKGAIRDAPDETLVWNEAQAEEAVRLHAIPRERVAVVGAHTYDHWFGWRPSTTREEFCARLGLDAARPIVLYVCSSPFIAGDREPGFAARWLRALRESGDPVLREAGVVLRPHPQNARSWATVDLSALGNVAIWPRAGASPVDEGRKSDYFDSLHHAAAVVGLNTSALVESAIVGRPVFTLLTSEFRSTQEGTLHFAHLAGARDDGVLVVARSLEEHTAQLAAALADPAPYRERLDAFVREFVRPGGAELPAAPRLAARLAGLAELPRPEPERAPRRRALLLPLLLPLLTAVALGELVDRERDVSSLPRRRLRRLLRRVRRLRRLGAWARPRGPGVVVTGLASGEQLAALRATGLRVRYARAPKGGPAPGPVGVLAVPAGKRRTARLALRIEEQLRRRERGGGMLRLLAAAAPLDPRLLHRLGTFRPDALLVVPPADATVEAELERAARRLGIRWAVVPPEALTPETVRRLLETPRPRPLRAPLRLALDFLLWLGVLAVRVRKAARIRTRLRALATR